MPNEAVETSLREQIETLVVIATGRVVTAADLHAAGGVLDAAGVNSIGYINLLEALERRYGVAIDPEEAAQHLLTVDSIEQLIRAHQGCSS